MRPLARVLAGALVVALLVPGLVRADGDTEQLCRERLARLAAGVKVHRLVHEGRSPTSISELYYEGFLRSCEDVVCPASGTAAPPRTEIDAKTDYTFDPLAGAPEGLLVREKAPYHAAGTVLAAYLDGTIRAVAVAPLMSAAPGHKGVEIAPIPLAALGLEVAPHGDVWMVVKAASTNYARIGDVFFQVGDSMTTGLARDELLRLLTVPPGTTTTLRFRAPDRSRNVFVEYVRH